MSWSGRTSMVALTVIVSVVIASAASSCGDVGSGSAGEGPSVHAPEELLAALLATSDIPGSTGGQGIAASSYDSTFDFSPCDAADDLAYHRVPQAETELRSDAADWWQIIVSSADAAEWFDEIVAAYETCTAGEPDAGRSMDAPPLADASATFGFRDPIRLTVFRSGYDLSIVMRSGGDPDDPDAYTDIVATAAERLASLPPPAPTNASDDAPSAQAMAADSIVEEATSVGLELDRECVDEKSARLSDDDAAIINAARRYDGSPYYLSEEGASIYFVESLGCLTPASRTDVLVQVVGDEPGVDLACVRTALEDLTAEEFVEVLRSEFDPANEAVAALFDRLEPCGVAGPDGTGG